MRTLGSLGRWSAWTALWLALGSASAQALPIAIGAHERRVAAEGESGTGYVSAADSTAALGSALLDAIAPPLNQGAWALGRANLDSEISTSALSADAVTLTFATAPAGEFKASTAEVLYRVEFTPTEDVSLRLFGSLSWGVEDPAQLVTFVELASVDTTLDPLLLHYALDGPENEVSFDTIAPLRAGLTYRLVGFVRNTADAFGDEFPGAHGGFSFDLVAVPEPGTAWLLGCGVAVLCRRAVGG